MSVRRRQNMVFGTVVALLGVLSAAQGATITYDLTWQFGEPSGSSPTGTPVIQFADVAAGLVRMTIDLTALGSTEKVKEIYFNFDEVNFPLMVSTVQYVGGTQAKSVRISDHRAIHGYKADGDGYYNGVLEYFTSSGSFNAGATSVYDISYAGLDAQAFSDYLSAPGGGQGRYAVAMHLQSVPPSGESLWLADPDGRTTGPNLDVTVPAPSSRVLFMIGVVALVLFARKRRPSEPLPAPARHAFTGGYRSSVGS
jgi:hypothetical protein